MSDPLGDMLTRIRNGQRARQAVVASPASKMRANVLEVLKREGYIRGFSQDGLRPGVAELKIELKYVDGEPVIREIARVSKPGRRIYSRLADLPRVYNGLGISKPLRRALASASVLAVVVITTFIPRTESTRS